MTTTREGADPLLITCVGVETDLALLPHFLTHYLGLGVRPERVRAILNARSEGEPGLDAADAILARHGCPPGRRWLARYTSDTMWAERRVTQTAEAAPGDWVLSADVDEFHEYPAALPEFLAYCERLGVDCVQGPFIDRLAPDGRLAPVEETPHVLEQFPVEAEVTLSLGGEGKHHDRGGSLKMMAMKAHVVPRRGGHGPEPGTVGAFLTHRALPSFPGIVRPGFRFRIPVRVHHLHWVEGLEERLRRRLATPGVSAAGREYGQKQLDHIERHGGIALDRVAQRTSDDPLPWRLRLALLRAEGRARGGEDQLRAAARRLTGKAA